MPETVAVIGGGLVGALQACVMAQKGYDVHLYEYRLVNITLPNKKTHV